MIGFAEVGVLAHEGREFSALGAGAAEDMSVVVGYVAKDAASGRWHLTTWGGEFMYVVLQPEGVWVRRTPHSKTTMRAWSAVIGGRRYSGRNGDADLLVLRRSPR